MSDARGDDDRYTDEESRRLLDDGQDGASQEEPGTARNSTASDDATLPPAARQHFPKPSPQVVTLRVAFVARTLTQGATTAVVRQVIAKEQGREAKARHAYRQAGADEPETIREHPVLWGDTPIPDRTVDAYIARAKALLAQEGTKLTKQREYILGRQLSRIDELYAAAFSAGRYYVCVQLIEVVNRMFGLEEAVRILLLGAGNQEAAQQAADDLGSFSTPEGKARRMAELMGRAVGNNPALADILARASGLRQLSEAITRHVATAPSGVTATTEN